MGGKIILKMSVLAAMSILICSCLSENQLKEIVSQRYHITIDYDQSIEELIKAGRYYRAYSEITSGKFPTNETGTRGLMVTLVRLDGNSTIQQVLAAQAKNGLRPASIRELLTFGKGYAEILNKVSIVAFGSYRKYYVTSYLRFGTDPKYIDEVKTLERFFPYLVVDLFGRAALLIQEDLIPSYDPSGFHACFVTEE